MLCLELIRDHPSLFNWMVSIYPVYCYNMIFLTVQIAVHTAARVPLTRRSPELTVRWHSTEVHGSERERICGRDD